MALTTKMTNKKLTVKGVVLLLVTLSGALHLTLAQAADPRNGAKIYNNHCTGCHGAQGNGMMPGMPNFLRGEGLMKPDAALVQTLERGAGMMPAFRGLLTTQEMLDVVAYLRTIH
ncbi:MAG: cytochrome c [Pseudomonadota bacterium]|nr:cytochrome c [Pseudomonadota bacterium]